MNMILLFVNSIVYTYSKHVDIFVVFDV